MSDDNDLLLIGDLDQAIDTDNDWMETKIDEIIKRSIKEKNAYIALDAAKTLVGVAKLSSFGLAKLLYYTKKNWHRYKITETFEEVAYDRVGIAPANIDRYIRVWGMFDNALIPQDYVEELQQRNIKDLIPLANALYQGFEVEQEEFEKLVDAPDYNSFAKIVREDIKGKPPRKGALSLYLDLKGTIWGIQDKERKFVGSLEIDSDDDIVLKAVDRIVKGAGMLRSE